MLFFTSVLLYLKILEFIVICVRSPIPCFVSLSSVSVKVYLKIDAPWGHESQSSGSPTLWSRLVTRLLVCHVSKPLLKTDAPWRRVSQSPVSLMSSSPVSCLGHLSPPRIQTVSWEWRTLASWCCVVARCATCCAVTRAACSSAAASRRPHVSASARSSLSASSACIARSVSL